MTDFAAYDAYEEICVPNGYTCPACAHTVPWNAKHQCANTLLAQGATPR